MSGKVVHVELDDLLNAMDRAEANLAKLENVWNRAASFIPTSPTRGSDPEYDDLGRARVDLLPGLPPIDGWTITDPLPDIDALGQGFIDYMDIGEPPFALYEAGDQPNGLALDDLPWVEQVELDFPDDVGDAGLAGLASGEVVGFLGFPWAGPVGAVADEESGHEDFQHTRYGWRAHMPTSRRTVLIAMRACETTRARSRHTAKTP
jgi:hypothetical protein